MGVPSQNGSDSCETSPLTGHMQLVQWLKTEHGMGTRNAVVAHTLREDAD